MGQFGEMWLVLPALELTKTSIIHIEVDCFWNINKAKMCMMQIGIYVNV